MFILKSIFFLSILLLIDGQWYIKKNYRNKFMNYPNPGKRSLYDDESVPIETDCQIPYSKLYSRQQILAWILKCDYKNLQTNENDELSSSSSASQEFDLPIKSRRILDPNLPSRIRRPYLMEYSDDSSYPFLLKLVRRFVKRK